MAGKFRVEKDTLGDVKVPAQAYYGAQTSRAVKNFPISGITPRPSFIKATAAIKLAAVRVNAKLGLIDKRKARAIARAAAEVYSGKFDKEFVVDVFQAGAGTSHNMNANEVIANRALELTGRKRGEYSFIHPNDDVNMGQSTNDVFPTAMRIAAIWEAGKTAIEAQALAKAFDKKGREFKDVVKSGRTHLQDAVPVMLGGEFRAYGASIERCAFLIEASVKNLTTLGLGGTATGTGLNSHPRYQTLAARELTKITGMKGLCPSADLHEAMNSMAPFTALSGAMRTLAVELIRITGDIRLMASGPNTGLSEIRLPAVQPGSSIMPGKVNPSMAEMLGMAAFEAVGNDITVASAAGAGQLELNVMMPVISHNVLQTASILANAMRAFNARCVRGIKADKKRCREYFERSAGLATILNTVIGYEKAAIVAKESVRTGKTVREIIFEKKILTPKALERALDTKRVTAPSARTKPRR